MKNLLSSIALSALVMFLGFYQPVQAWDKTNGADSAKPDEVATLELLAEVDLDMYKLVKAKYEDVTKPDSKIKVLKVDINSPGGNAVLGADIARWLRKLSDERKIRVEIHAHGVCASMCTVLLASGTPGARYIQKHTFFLVHPVQRMSLFGSSCVEHKEKATAVEEKAGNTILEIMRDLYVEFTGQPVHEVESWVSCGSERVGQGKLAVQMKIADKVED